MDISQILPRYWMREGYNCVFGGKNKRAHSSSGNHMVGMGLKGGAPLPKKKDTKLFFKIS